MITCALVCSTAAPLTAQSNGSTTSSCATNANACSSTCGNGVVSNGCVTSCAPGGGIAGIDAASKIDKDARTVTPLDLGLEDVTKEVASIREKYHVPSLAVALVRGLEVVAAGAAGVREAYESQPVSITDKYHLGSCGKAFTATIAAELVSAGVISWNSRIGEVFADSKIQVSSQYSDVTLAQLLSHRSGLPVGPDRLAGNSLWDQVMNSSATPEETRAHLVTAALNTPPLASPGEGFLYTDYGFIVAGAMLEQASGMGYSALLQKYIVTPFGLESVGEGAPGEYGKNNEPRGHVQVSGRFVPLSPKLGADLAHPAIQPAGTIHASIIDWAKFAAVHLKRIKAERDASSQETIATEFYRDHYNQGYVNGWQIGRMDADINSPIVYHHSGSCGAWAARIWIIPEKDIAIVATSNFGGSAGFAAVDEALKSMYSRETQVKN